MPTATWVIALHNQGRLDDAIDAYKKSISLKPDYAETYSNMGNVLLAQGRLDEAIEVLEKSISLNPNLVEAYINMGNCFPDQDKLMKL